MSQDAARETVLQLLTSQKCLTEYFRNKEALNALEMNESLALKKPQELRCCLCHQQGAVTPTPVG